MAKTSYAIALGSNRRHGRHGRPAGVIAAAIDALRTLGSVARISTILPSPALGPAGRDFANAAALLETELAPETLLGRLKAIEREFGRRGGRRWGPRVLDLDIILWSEGVYQGPSLAIPHPDFRDRHFVLGPLAEIVPVWRDPIGGVTVRQLWFRLRTPRSVDPSLDHP